MTAWIMVPSFVAPSYTKTLRMAAWKRVQRRLIAWSMTAQPNVPRFEDSMSSLIFMKDTPNGYELEFINGVTGSIGRQNTYHRS